MSDLEAITQSVCSLDTYPRKTKQQKTPSARPSTIARTGHAILGPLGSLPLQLLHQIKLLGLESACEAICTSSNPVVPEPERVLLLPPPTHPSTPAPLHWLGIPSGSTPGGYDRLPLLHPNGRVEHGHWCRGCWDANELFKKGKLTVDLMPDEVRHVEYGLRPYAMLERADRLWSKEGFRQHLEDCPCALRHGRGWVKVFEEMRRRGWPGVFEEMRQKGFAPVKGRDYRQTF